MWLKSKREKPIFKHLEATVEAISMTLNQGRLFFVIYFLVLITYKKANARRKRLINVTKIRQGTQPKTLTKCKQREECVRHIYTIEKALVFRLYGTLTKL